jgi:hypothetical protein
VLKTYDGVMTVSNKFCQENWTSAFRILKLDPCLSSYTRINKTWTEDRNIRPETLKLVQEIASNILELIGIGNDFLYRTKWLRN